MYQHFADLYDEIFPFDGGLEIDLKPFIKPHGQAIDLGCGTGRLVHLVNHMGMKMRGVDLDQQMVDVAKKNFPNDEFMQGDMVTSMKLNSYDLITCFGNTLPHLKPVELSMFFNHIFDKLSPDGYFIVTMLNYDQILESKPSQLPVIKRENITFERYYTYQEDHIIFKTVLSHNHQQTEDETILFPYTKTRLEKITSEAKLKVTFYKNIKLDSYDIHHSHICMIITK